MGQALAASIEDQSDLELVGVWRKGTDLDALLANADVAIDFSLPQGTELVLQAAARNEVPLVCGVSGLGDRLNRELRDTAMCVPLVYDRNMSLGIAVLERSVRQAATALGTAFEVSIAEVHHVHKKDAPSGTALKLGEAIAEARGESGTDHIKFESERRGEVPGDHQVTMRTPTETLTFGHSVTTRQVFVDGALRAARWVQDVLFRT